jgi:5-methylcytosine-specific restriction endonuclease McrA
LPDPGPDQPDTHEVDHIVAQKHGGMTQADNLALSCSLCNKHKGTDLTTLEAGTGEIVPLYHPRRDRWTDHFRLNGAEIEPLTSVGRATVRLLQLNRSERITERELLIRAGVLRMPAE